MARDAVEQVLARRRARPGVQARRALLGSLALHAGLAVAILVVPLLARGDQEPLEFVGEVMIVPAAALGVRNPAPAPQPAPPEPEPAPPEPEPTPPEPEPVPDTRPAPPQPEPRRPEPQRIEPRASTPPPSSGDELRRRQGSPQGSSLGTASFGVAGIDPAFAGKYNYYAQQLLAMVSSAWARPSIGDAVQTVVSFRIQRDGSITPPRITRSSGYSSFDLAALRAVQGAAPFPRLPQTYKEDSVGVNLIFE